MPRLAPAEIRPMRLIIALALLLSLATSALGAEGVLIATTGQTKIPVWRSAQAQDDGQALLRSKVDAALVMPLLSCIAEPGTRAVIAGQDPGLYRRPVILLNGAGEGLPRHRRERELHGEGG